MKLKRRKSGAIIKIFPECECGCKGIVSKGSRFLIGHARKGKKSSPEHVRKISIALTGRPGLFGELNPFYGKKHSDESKRRMSNSLKGKYSGINHPMFGKKHSEESKEKMSISLKGKPTWNKGLKGLPGRPCSDEVKKVLSQKSKELWKNPKHRERISKSISGLKHPFYRNRPGLTLESLGREYPFDFNDKLKELIRDRDNRRCQLCTISEKEHGKKMHVHHIDYDKDNINPDNLISLCKSCHGKTEHNRDKWQSFFMGRYRIKRRKVA